MKSNNWDKFWQKNIIMTPGKSTVFFNNWLVMQEILEKHFNTDCLDAKNLTSLEVGCGRGTMSNYMHYYGVDTTGLDVDSQFEAYNRGGFINANILTMSYSKLAKMKNYDIVFTYGLLEHFNTMDQAVLLHRCKFLTKPDGISIHYVVPQKLTNTFENKDVGRSHCSGIIDDTVQWVYPVFNIGPWRTNKWLGKGFFYVR